MLVCAPDTQLLIAPARRARNCANPAGRSGRRGSATPFAFRKARENAGVTFGVTRIFRTEICSLPQSVGRDLRFRPWPPSTEATRVYSRLRRAEKFRRERQLQPFRRASPVYIHLFESTYSDAPGRVSFRDSRGAMLTPERTAVVRYGTSSTNSSGDSVLTDLRARLRSHPHSSAQPCR